MARGNLYSGLHQYANTTSAKMAGLIIVVFCIGLGLTVMFGLAWSAGNNHDNDNSTR